MKLKNQHLSLFTDAIDQGFIEVLGSAELESFKSSGQVTAESDGLGYLAAIDTFLLERYVPAEAAGIAISIGKCCWFFIKLNFAEVLEFNDLEFRLQSPLRRTKIATCRVADDVFNPAGILLSVTSTSNQFCWESAMPMSDKAFSVHVLAGMIQEMLSDVSGGKHYQIEIVTSGKSDDVGIVFKGDTMRH